MRSHAYAQRPAGQQRRRGAQPEGGGARWPSAAVLAKIASVACTQIGLRLAPVEVLGVESGARLELIMNDPPCCVTSRRRAPRADAVHDVRREDRADWPGPRLSWVVSSRFACAAAAHFGVDARLRLRARATPHALPPRGGGRRGSAARSAGAAPRAHSAARIGEPAAALARGAVAAGLLWARPDLQAAALGWAQVAAALAAGLARS